MQAQGFDVSPVKAQPNTLHCVFYETIDMSDSKWLTMFENYLVQSFRILSNVSFSGDIPYCNVLDSFWRLEIILSSDRNRLVDCWINTVSAAAHCALLLLTSSDSPLAASSTCIGLEGNIHILSLLFNLLRRLLCLAPPSTTCAGQNLP